MLWEGSGREAWRSALREIKSRPTFQPARASREVGTQLRLAAQTCAGPGRGRDRWQGTVADDFRLLKPTNTNQARKPVAKEDAPFGKREPGEPGDPRLALREGRGLRRFRQVKVNFVPNVKGNKCSQVK